MSAMSRIAPAAAALAAAAFLVACGGGSTPTSAPAEPTAAPASAAPAASVAPVEAAADPGRLCVMLAAKVEGLDVYNPALVGEMAPVIKLVTGKPICKTGAGGKKIADAPVIFKVMQAGAPVAQVRAFLSGQGEVTAEILSADAATVLATHVLTVGTPDAEADLAGVKVALGATANEDGDPVLTVAPF
ncbi:MAG: hypothetical protein ACKOTZ_10775 [Chloroflexota bacterium]